MKNKMETSANGVKVRPYFLSLAVAWSLIFIILLITGWIYIKNDHLEKARNSARINFTKDRVLREWVASHGGLYVPESDKTPSNPYLSHIPDRDIKGPSGKQLTLMNPAYAMRQISDMYHAAAGIKVHITGLKYFRPETAPDLWEKVAINRFKNGAKEVFELTEYDGKPFIRLMKPLMATESCLKCHGHQGYKTGGVRGGVSVSIPMAPYNSEIKEQQLLMGSFLFILWGIGLAGLNFISTKLNEKMKEQKVLESQLIQSEKLASIGVLVSGIVHEINNPNNFISFNLPILKDYLEKIMPIVDSHAEKEPDMKLFYMPYTEFREDIFNLIDNVQHGSERILAIIENLKGFSKTNNGTMVKRLELTAIVEKVLTFTRNKINKNVKTFKVHLPESPPVVTLNVQSLEQILINILTNASQSFDESDYDTARIDFSVFLNEAEKGIDFEIKDNGCGMDKETLKNIFLPFFTTKPPDEGTGLGLYICHTLVEKMGGTIEVRSRKGEGSIFSVKFKNIYS